MLKSGFDSVVVSAILKYRHHLTHTILKMIYFRALLRLILFLHSNFSDSFPDGAECCVPLSEDCVLDTRGIIAVVSSMLFGALIFSAIVNRSGDFVIYNFNTVSIYLCVLSFASCVLNFEITLNHSLELNTLSLSCCALLSTYWLVFFKECE